MAGEPMNPDAEWDIPVVDLARPLSEEAVRADVHEAITGALRLPDDR